MKQVHDRLGPNGLLWLEVRFGGRVQVFCCAPEDDQAIVLGGKRSADIRVMGPGVAPVIFHFERDVDHLLIVPAYGAQVRVNSMLVRGPTPVPTHAVIEFSGIRIEVLTHAACPDEGTASRQDPPESESRIKYLSLLPTDTQTTKLALQVYPHVEDFQAGIQTCETPLELDDDFLTTHRLVRHALDRPTTDAMDDVEVTTTWPAQLERTLRMERVAPETFDRPPLGPLDAPSPPPPEVPSSPAGLGWQETTAFDLDSLKADLAAAPTPQVKVGPPPLPTATQQKKKASRPLDSGSPPLTRRVPAPRPSASGGALAALGEKAKARPLAVAAAALGVSVAITLMLVGLSHVLGAKSWQMARSPNTVSSPAVAVPTEARRTSAAEAAPLSVAALASAPLAEASNSTSNAPAAISPLAMAAIHLIGEHYAEAQSAYAKLAASHPENPAYEALARLLERRSSAACQGSGASRSCPEVVP